MDMRTYMKNTDKIELRDPLSIEDLYNLMAQYWQSMPGRFEVKKSLFGTAIVFDEFMSIEPRITVKGNMVIVGKSKTSTEVSVMGISPSAIKHTQQQAQAAQQGGLSKAFTGGQDYFLRVCEAMRWLLGSRMAPPKQ